MTTHHEWPNREEWAERRRTMYVDMRPDDVSKLAHHYMSEHEIHVIINKLTSRRNQLGKELREGKKRCPQAFRRKGETSTEFSHRWYALSKEEMEFDVWTWPRSQIFQAVKLLTRGIIPILPSDGGDCPELAELQQRYEVAYEAAEERLRAKVEATPIDDEAWAAELRWRAEMDANPSGISIRFG
jgi:hypothetical protein